GPHGSPAHLSGARRNDEGHEPKDEGDRRHHHRAKPHLSAEHGSILDRPAGLALLLGKLDDQDAVLGGERDQDDETYLRIKIEIEPRKTDREIGAEHADSDREEHRHRDRPALVERDQEEIGEQYCETQYDAGLPGGLLLLKRRPGPFIGEA